MAANENEKFTLVEIDSLQAGMLVDRSLHVYLPVNQRYVLLVKPFRPLEARMLEKFKRLGQVYSSEPEIDARHPQLAVAASAVRAMCDDQEISPFEKNRNVRTASEWLVQHVLGAARAQDQDDYAAVFFFHRAFGVPKPETLLHVADVSIVAYERGLRTSALSGLLALWLGYADTVFLSQFVETVFCAEIRSDAPVPGVMTADFRFRNPSPGDELAEVVTFVRWLLAPKSGKQSAPDSRVARKLGRQFSAAVPKKAAA